VSTAIRGGASPGRRAVTLAVAVVVLVLLAVGGTFLPAQPATFRSSPLPVVGRTSLTCTPAVFPGARGYLAAAALRQAPGRTGTLTGTQVGGAALGLRLSEQGRATLLPGPAQPTILQGEGVMATAASAMMFSRATSGSLTGLMAAPCGVPDTDHWFVGVGASQDNRTDLVLTNPDEGEAEVDLRFYGRTGLVVVPGSPGLVIEGRSSRTVSLDSLVEVEGPLTVAVRAGRGRVAAMALDRRSDDLRPRGADWQPSSVAPTSEVVIPGVPEGAGRRELVVVNPGSERAEVAVELLGIEGPFVPVGAEGLVVAPESTTTVDLTAGLGGLAGNVRIRSTRPVTAAVHALSAESGDEPDLAVSPAGRPINRAGIVPLATVDGLDSEFTLSNAGPAPATVSYEVFDYAGRSLRTDDITIIPGGSATRRLTSPAPSYLVVRAPAGSSVYGALSYTGTIGGAAGLATMPITSPDQAATAPQVRFDPSLGR
jgi:hypothetical protein